VRDSQTLMARKNRGKLRIGKNRQKGERSRGEGRW
jgi:hypothetical protein